MTSTPSQLVCQACARPCNMQSPACPGCNVMHYCSTQHMQAHRKHAHGPEECERMAQQLQRGQALLEHYMPWPVQDPKALAAWLQKLGCQHGLLQQCLQLLPHPSSSTQETLDTGSDGPTAAISVATLPGTEAEWLHAWGSPDASLCPAWRIQRLGQQDAPANWRQYYASRGISPESPAALVLHSVLTLWHCLVNILPAHGWPLPAAGGTISLAYLGPRNELDLLPAFAELALLLPDHNLDLHFIGPDVPEQLHRLTCSTAVGAKSTHQQDRRGALQFSCWASCFHDAWEDWAHERSSKESAEHTAALEAPLGQGWRPAIAPDGGSFHLVFAANAGIPAFPSWVPTLQQLASMAPQQAARVAQPAAQLQGPDDMYAATHAADEHSGVDKTPPHTGIPVLFSDYCEEAVFMSGQMVQHVLGRAFTLGCCMNPFRDPVPATAHGLALPACSNAFVFGWL